MDEDENRPRNLGDGKKEKINKEKKLDDIHDHKYLMYSARGTKCINISMNNHLIIHDATFTGFSVFYTTVN